MLENDENECFSVMAMVLQSLPFSTSFSNECVVSIVVEAIG